jgi:hypothetical protein
MLATSEAGGPEGRPYLTPNDPAHTIANKIDMLAASDAVGHKGRPLPGPDQTDAHIYQ